MPGGLDPDESGGSPAPRPGLWDRLRGAVFKPVDPDAPHAEVAAPPTKEELEDEVKRADDKERLVGLFGAPVGAAISTILASAQLANDPSQYLRNGQVNPHYISVTETHELLLVLLGLCVAMLVTAWFRKRLLLGIVMALFGLSLFNLKFWGFGVPFILAGAWLLVRAYRLNRDLREATPDDAPGSGTARRGGGLAPAPRPQPNKRYTPKSTPPKRPAPPSSDGEQKAG